MQQHLLLVLKIEASHPSMQLVANLSGYEQTAYYGYNSYDKENEARNGASPQKTAPCRCGHKGTQLTQEDGSKQYYAQSKHSCTLTPLVHALSGFLSVSS